ncbi:hypothetical protein MUDAN_BIHEEGNE_01629 [Lactiplantibacillus mudanjiangensis]|nr:hypothetical protein MUDAN_BIHEEGNE_01629 [Lactiplantibacillus mudanjiangensis]
MLADDLKRARQQKRINVDCGFATSRRALPCSHGAFNAFAL